MSIHLLPPDLASQIAAGEVVERPASVVKELLENSLDAGASQISITVEGAGQRLIEVADNGSGIPASELALAIERHATSKLDRREDLFRIVTLGFRGEALASIGSVARMTITSRSAASTAGARLRVEGGNADELQVIGAPVGTIVRVEDLFYNVPARLKFLKQEATERRLIDTLVTRYAVAYPRVRFHLVQEGRSSLQTSGKGERREVLAAMYGVDIARQMLEVLSEGDGLRIQGFISPPAISRTNRKEMTFYVNGRPIADAALSAAMLQGYHTLLMVGRYPVGLLFIEMPPEVVDVNVHPTKAEVRFSQPERIFSEVQRAVRRALLAHTPVPDLGASLHWNRPEGGSSRTIDPAWQMSAEAKAEAPTDPESAVGMSYPVDAADPFDNRNSGRQTSLSSLGSPILRLIGQIANTYLVAEGPDGLYLIDQHAAHERVLFERFMKARQSQVASQSLLQPTVVELPAASSRLLSDQLPILAHLGFEIEPFGHNAFLVRAVPALLSGSDPAAGLRALVEDFEEDETPLQAESEARLIARICKRSAVKAGHRLSSDEQQALLSDLEACQSPRTCPHGRPTMIHLSVDLLERQFGRKGAF